MQLEFKDPGYRYSSSSLDKRIPARICIEEVIAHYIVQGLVRSVDSSSDECQQSHLCHGFRSAETTGTLGRILSKITRWVVVLVQVAFSLALGASKVISR